MAAAPLTADDEVPRHDVPVGGRSGFTVIDDRQVHYLEWGTVRGANVLCLHGGGQTAYMYEELGSVLAPRYHVLAPDLPNHGDSDWIDRVFAFCRGADPGSRVRRLCDHADLPPCPD